ncbi:cytochrome b/b6 domain-containing protein [Ostreiculturibacter nitratireducens]|uniref:cytochrome b/b6 domain-containing protein n=1 Tax=Ostreiculturibacter nitratireducens TaxID=3075226 RepID=UPI0031B57727
MAVPNESKSVRVWDLGVRLFHWALVTCFVAAYLIERPRDLHEAFGYAVAGLVAFRLVWGVIGTRHARFTDFVPGPRRFLGYLRDMIRGVEARYLGHNPAGGAMIIALLTILAGICATGVMMGMDAYFGESWVEEAHEALVSVALALVVLHVAGVALSSLRHGENLVHAMITGRKAKGEHRA